MVKHTMKIVTRSSCVASCRTHFPLLSYTSLFFFSFLFPLFPLLFTFYSAFVSLCNNSSSLILRLSCSQKPNTLRRIIACHFITFPLCLLLLSRSHTHLTREKRGSGIALWCHVDYLAHKMKRKREKRENKIR
jgi:hypothetical protein